MDTIIWSRIQFAMTAAFTIVPGVKVPRMLSILATHDPDGYVPGINDILNGYTDNDGNVVPSVAEKMTGFFLIHGLSEQR